MWKRNPPREEHNEIPTICYQYCILGHSMGSGITEVPGGSPQKYLQVNTLVPTGSQHLNTCVDGGDHMSLKNPPNPQVPLRKLPYLVIFTPMGVTSLSTSACGPHPSWMGVITLVNKNTRRYHLWGPHAMPYCIYRRPH